MFAAAQHQRPIPGAVATIGVNDRVAFLRKTYAHLLGAVLAFAGLEYLLLSPSSPLFEAVTIPMITAMGQSRFGWLIVLGLFIVVGRVADGWARSDTSRAMQYVGLGLYTVAEALIFTPLLLMAEMRFPGVITDSAVLTVFLFAGLTATVFITKKDFSFLRGALTIGSFAAMGLIVVAILFNFDLGALFSAGMLILAAGYILYYTSQILAHYRPTQHVSAALALFAAVALMFWYVVSLLMSLRE